MIARFLLSLMVVLCTSSCSQSARYEQLFIGYNGPSVAKTEYFRSAASVKGSWVARSLSSAELERVLSRISFEREMLAAAAVGARETVTQVSLASISQYKLSALSTNIRIGVIETGCSQPHAMSFPFVLAVVEPPEKFDGSGSFDHQNYPDGCKAVVSGISIDHAP